MKIQVEKCLVGAALAVALPVLLPIMKKTAKPLINQGTDWAKNLVKQAQIITAKAKHELEDIWFEAQYERMQKNWERKSYTFTD
ncbi:MAG: DUF5132 domain-containing protein [Thermoactinomyces sp.]|jgi:hypothetical protein